MTRRTLMQRIKRFLGTKPPKPKRPKTSKLRNVKTAIYTLKQGHPAVPSKQPDSLVEMARDVASDILAHPEKYITNVMGQEAMVVDDASYEALFYLFAGKTRQQMWEQDKKIAAIFVHQYTVLSHSLLADARQAEQGWR